MAAVSTLGLALAGVLLLQEQSLAATSTKKGLDADAIAASSGAKASTTPDGTVRLGWPRTDVSVMVDGVALKPFAGLGCWAAFTPAPSHKAMLMGDTVVFADEVNPAIDAAFAHDLEVTGLHNHFFFDEPKVYFMHIGGHGDPTKLAEGVKAVWDAIKAVRAASAQPATSFGGGELKPGTLDAASLERALGVTPEVKDGIAKFTIGREGKMHGIKVGGSMGLTTWAAFMGSDASAAIDGDFMMFDREVQPVLHALRANKINIVALHNHMIGESPGMYFVHFWGKGPAAGLANGLSAALAAQRGAAGSGK